MKPVVLFVKLLAWILLLQYVSLNFLYERDFRTAAFLPFTPFLPFVPFFDWIPGKIFGAALATLYFGSTAFVISGIHFRKACLALSAALLLSLLCARNSYGNDIVYCVLVFFWAGFSSSDEEATRNMKYQLALVYAGAAISKLFDPDWLSGEYMAAWIPFFRAEFIGWVPERLICWATIGIEILLPAMILTGWKKRWIPAVGVGFHSVMSLISGATFHMFFFDMTATYLLFFEWRPGREVWKRLTPYMVFSAVFVAASPNWRLLKPAYALVVTILFTAIFACVSLAKGETASEA
jgi:hypothetical protein